MATTNFKIDCSTVEASDGVKLQAAILRPRERESSEGDLAVVLVHPYSIMGGCQALVMGIARELVHRGYVAVTFDMRGVGSSTGKASFTGFKEIRDVVAVCNWVIQNLSVQRVLLVGSSAGAPIAGSAVDKVEQVVGYVSLGYPFGFISSILFGRHHKAILRSPKPKIFVMGTRDGFTSVKQLKGKLKSAAGHVEMRLLEGVTHFEMEGPAYDEQMAHLIVEFAEKHCR